MATRTGNRPAALPAGSRKAQGSRSTPDSARTNHGALNGLVKGGSLPPVKGRGRKADPVSDAVRELWIATLNGEGIGDLVLTQAEYTKLKRDHEKLEKEMNDSEGNQTVDTAYRCTEGHVATGKDDPKATPEVRILFQAHYLNAAAEVR